MELTVESKYKRTDVSASNPFCSYEYEVYLVGLEYGNRLQVLCILSQFITGVCVDHFRLFVVHKINLIRASNVIAVLPDYDAA